ncbi:conserved exported hypothetical protein [Paraburkholderia piptadeniae]|uniref:Uncharacterized protein n=1 Tax=Paraburkholderia piptadeniae TaxID=1701573 RepID=A0A1N7RRI3_9BURK|nr:hypothetical protein [Paraburkholderia piptadeniae]SIT37750.1 conserved exported hypothetical protein [Paraburkholderia piptadeniae]
MFNGNRILNILVAIFAVIGLVTVLGAAGMTAAHFSMMHGFQSCGHAMQLWQDGRGGGSGDVR